MFWSTFEKLNIITFSVKSHKLTKTCALKVIKNIIQSQLIKFKIFYFIFKALICYMSGFTLLIKALSFF